MVENRELRQRAREQLGNGIFTNPWLKMLVICLIYSGISALLGVIPTVGTIAAFVLSGPLMYLLYKTLLACVRGEQWGIETFFKDFDKKFGDKVIVGVLQSVLIFLWSLLFVIPGIVKSYSYAMTMYIYKDRPELGANDCITESRRMMDGYKWKLFCLDFSFIGWYFLGALCFGVGTLFVIPYHQMARANFYQELVNEKGVFLSTKTEIE